MDRNLAPNLTTAQLAEREASASTSSLDPVSARDLAPSGGGPSALDPIFVSLRDQNGLRDQGLDEIQALKKGHAVTDAHDRLRHDNLEQSTSTQSTATTVTEAPSTSTTPTADQDAHHRHVFNNLLLLDNDQRKKLADQIGVTLQAEMALLTHSERLENLKNELMGALQSDASAEVSAQKFLEALVKHRDAIAQARQDRGASGSGEIAEQLIAAAHALGGIDLAQAAEKLLKPDEMLAPEKVTELDRLAKQVAELGRERGAVLSADRVSQSELSHVDSRVAAQRQEFLNSPLAHTPGAHEYLELTLRQAEMAERFDRVTQEVWKRTRDIALHPSEVGDRRGELLERYLASQADLLANPELNARMQILRNDARRSAVGGSEYTDHRPAEYLEQLSITQDLAPFRTAMVTRGAESVQLLALQQALLGDSPALDLLSLVEGSSPADRIALMETYRALTGRDAIVDLAKRFDLHDAASATEFDLAVKALRYGGLPEEAIEQLLSARAVQFGALLGYLQGVHGDLTQTRRTIQHRFEDDLDRLHGLSEEATHRAEQHFAQAFQQQYNQQVTRTVSYFASEAMIAARFKIDQLNGSTIAERRFEHYIKEHDLDRSSPQFAQVMKAAERRLQRDLEYADIGERALEHAMHGGIGLGCDGEGALAVFEDSAVTPRVHALIHKVYAEKRHGKTSLSRDMDQEGALSGYSLVRAKIHALQTGQREDAQAISLAMAMAEHDAGRFTRELSQVAPQDRAWVEKRISHWIVNTSAEYYEQNPPGTPVELCRNQFSPDQARLVEMQLRGEPAAALALELHEKPLPELIKIVERVRREQGDIGAALVQRAFEVHDQVYRDFPSSNPFKGPTGELFAERFRTMSSEGFLWLETARRGEVEQAQAWKLRYALNEGGKEGLVLAQEVYAFQGEATGDLRHDMKAHHARLAQIESAFRSGLASVPDDRFESAAKGVPVVDLVASTFGATNGEEILQMRAFGEASQLQLLEKALKPKVWGNPDEFLAVVSKMSVTEQRQLFQLYHELHPGMKPIVAFDEQGRIVGVARDLFGGSRWIEIELALRHGPAGTRTIDQQVDCAQRVFAWAKEGLDLTRMNVGSWFDPGTHRSQLDLLKSELTSALEKVPRGADGARAWSKDDIIAVRGVITKLETAARFQILAKDSVGDLAANVGAMTALTVVTAMTGGTTSEVTIPAMMAIGAGTSATTRIAMKAAFKGDRLGRAEAAQDSIYGAVDGLSVGVATKGAQLLEAGVNRITKGGIGQMLARKALGTAEERGVVYGVEGAVEIAEGQAGRVVLQRSYAPLVDKAELELLGEQLLMKNILRRTVVNSTKATIVSGGVSFVHGAAATGVTSGNWDDGVVQGVENMLSRGAAAVPHGMFVGGLVGAGFSIRAPQSVRMARELKPTDVTKAFQGKTLFERISGVKRFRTTDLARAEKIAESEGSFTKGDLENFRLLRNERQVESLAKRMGASAEEQGHLLKMWRESGENLTQGEAKLHLWNKNPQLKGPSPYVKTGRIENVARAQRGESAEAKTLQEVDQKISAFDKYIAMQERWRANLDRLRTVAVKEGGEIPGMGSQGKAGAIEKDIENLNQQVAKARALRDEAMALREKFQADWDKVKNAPPKVDPDKAVSLGVQVKIPRAKVTEVEAAPTPKPAQSPVWLPGREDLPGVTPNGQSPLDGVARLRYGSGAEPTTSSTVAPNKITVKLEPESPAAPSGKIVAKPSPSTATREATQGAEEVVEQPANIIRDVDFRAPASPADATQAAGGSAEAGASELGAEVSAHTPRTISRTPFRRAVAGTVAAARLLAPFESAEASVAAKLEVPPVASQQLNVGARVQSPVHAEAPASAATQTAKVVGQMRAQVAPPGARVLHSGVVTSASAASTLATPGSVSSEVLGGEISVLEQQSASAASIVSGESEARGIAVVSDTENAQAVPAAVAGAESSTPSPTTPAAQSETVVQSATSSSAERSLEKDTSAKVSAPDQKSVEQKTEKQEVKKDTEETQKKQTEKETQKVSDSVTQQQQAEQQQQQEQQQQRQEAKQSEDGGSPRKTTTKEVPTKRRSNPPMSVLDGELFRFARALVHDVRPLPSVGSSSPPTSNPRRSLGGRREYIYDENGNLVADVSKEG